MLSIKNSLDNYCNNLEYYYNNSKEVPEFLESLNFNETFNKKGRQGMVGILTKNFKSPKEESKNKEEQLLSTVRNKEQSLIVRNKEFKFVFKISQHLDYITNHENVVMKGLDSLSPYLPHFCRPYGLLSCDSDPNIRKKGNPFLTNGVKKSRSKRNGSKGKSRSRERNYNIKKDVLFCEYIDGIKFSSFITNYKNKNKEHNGRGIYTPDHFILSLIKQVLLAICIAQRDKEFSHYDLHSDNILIRKCNKDSIFVYVLDKDNIFAVPTYGFYPVIIDYGYSYIKDMNGKSFFNTLAHTDVGFLTDRFDWIADPKLFLVTITSELYREDNLEDSPKRERRLKKKKNIWEKLNNIVGNIFGNLRIQWETGWDEEKYESASNITIDLLADYFEDSKLFSTYPSYCIDIFHSMMNLPLKNRNSNMIHVYISAFIHEFKKIEREIDTDFYGIYILKRIVDSCRENKVDYFRYEREGVSPNEKSKSISPIEKGKGKNKSISPIGENNPAILTFSRDIYTAIDSISKFTKIENIDFEKLFTSCIMLSNSMEGILYNIMNQTSRRKKEEYKNMTVENTLEIYGIIDINLPSDYVFTQDTEIVFMDTVKKGMYNLSYVNTDNKEVNDNDKEKNNDKGDNEEKVNTQASKVPFYSSKIPSDIVEELNSINNISWGNILYNLQNK